MMEIHLTSDNDVGTHVYLRDYHNIEISFYTEEENFLKILQDLEELHRKTLTTEKFIIEIEKLYCLGQRIVYKEKK